MANSTKKALEASLKKLLKEHHESVGGEWNE